MSVPLIPSLLCVDDKHLEANVRAVYAGGFMVASMSLDACIGCIRRGQWTGHSLYFWMKPDLLDITREPSHRRYAPTNSARHFITACRAPNARSAR